MTKGKNRYSLLFILTSLVLLSSCNSNIVYTDSLPLAGNKWELMDTRSFTVPITDTLNSNDVVFTIRTGSSYPFRNIFLFVKTTSPDGKSITDTLQFYLADEKGKRFGKGFGDIRALSLPYKSNVYFPHKGSYQFTVQHGMRSEELHGIYDFGLTIAKSRK